MPALQANPIPMGFYKIYPMLIKRFRCSSKAHQAAFTFKPSLLTFNSRPLEFLNLKKVHLLILSNANQPAHPYSHSYFSQTHPRLFTSFLTVKKNRTQTVRFFNTNLAKLKRHIVISNVLAWRCAFCTWRTEGILRSAALYRVILGGVITALILIGRGRIEAI